MTTNDRSHAFHGVVIHATSLSSLAILDNALSSSLPQAKFASLEADHSRRSGPLQAELARLRLLSHHIPDSPGPSTFSSGWTKLPSPTKRASRTPSHAKRVYGHVVDGMLRQGRNNSQLLRLQARRGHPRSWQTTCLARGQRALVGKCNMSRNAPDYYRDADERESLQVTLDCINHIRRIDPKGELVRHVLTPRFAICCEPSLLAGLGDLARQYPDMAIQTHLQRVGAGKEGDARAVLRLHQPKPTSTSTSASSTTAPSSPTAPS
ncbi:hypothetical protein J3458_019311 [Metarhizium acridum]|uniref:uncharacterized protein n=1 Tax=Metarhizium acridum TaxID=92637 RepID=UPI001C6AA582|nr:hypothetical protein J3458_019311 [Metarhizium acridum]